MRDLIQPSDAALLITNYTLDAEIVECPLELCPGRTLREPIYADRPFPPFDRSMMDGFAISASALENSDHLQIEAQAWAGFPEIPFTGDSDACVEIMTGATVPSQADCVIPYEETEKRSDGTIRLLNPHSVAPGDFIHLKGSDREEGGRLLDTGALLRSHEVALAATCGYSSLKVSKLPKISLISTGDELVPVEQKPLPHQIRRSNDSAVAAALLNFGCPVGHCAHIPDDPAQSKEVLSEVITESDFVLISGGISKGKKDFIPHALNTIGLDCVFHGVAQKPGKPMGFWANSSTNVFTLPGNPLSALTCLHAYVLPALNQYLGQPSKTPRTKVRLSENADSHDRLTVYLPVILSANNSAFPLPANNSGDLVTVASSHGYVTLPPGSKLLSSGTELDFFPWL